MLLLLLSRFSRVQLCATHRRQPTRLPRPWDSPGKNTGVGCHFLLQCTKVKRESEVAQSCPTPSDPMDCSLLHPWDLPGKSTGVGCHCLLHRHSMQVDKSEAGQAHSPELSACSAQQQREEHPGMQQIQVHRAGLQAHGAQGELLTDPPACTPRP